MIGRQLLLFSIAGTVGFLTDVGVLYAALGAGAGFYSGRVLSFLVAAFVTWVFNRRFTFPDRARVERWWFECLRYFQAMSLGAAVNYLCYAGVVHTMSMDWWTPMLGVAAGSAAGLGINFLLARQWVFKST
jgi:putative flippase GtrA